MFDVKSDKGVVSAIIPANGYADAAIVGDLAAAEFQVERFHAFNGTEQRRAECLVDLTFQGREAMQTFAIMLLDRCGSPALTERQWRVVADVLETSGAREPHAIAASIRSALS